MADIDVCLYLYSSILRTTHTQTESGMHFIWGDYAATVNALYFGSKASGKQSGDFS